MKSLKRVLSCLVLAGLAGCGIVWPQPLEITYRSEAFWLVDAGPSSYRGHPGVSMTLIGPGGHRDFRWLASQAIHFQIVDGLTLPIVVIRWRRQGWDSMVDCTVWCSPRECHDYRAQWFRRR